MKKGIDVSYANGSIDWAAAKKDIDFAIIRSSFGSDLPSQIDSYFYQNANGCVKNNIPFGTYHFAYFTSVEKAKGEADFAIRLADEYKDKVRFIALDIEEDSVRYARAVGSVPNWTDCAVAFCERIKAAGYTPVIYTNQSWIESVFNWDKLKQYKLWYAAPGASKPKYDCAIWQYSWNGHFSGSIFNTDMDYCYDDELVDGKKETEKPIPSEKEQISQINSSKPVDYDVIITAEDGVNIRCGASTNYKKIGAIPCGVKVHISKQTSGGGYTWGLTTYAREIGWIALEFTKKVPKKTVSELAYEVIGGKWAAGDERKKLLIEAGYSYDEVQKKVNEIMSKM
ncbi:MAG: hypothetical protein II685_07445 [Clostridia bacterium]|nr:hypothetical protein [Clostridia bacterium]